MRTGRPKATLKLNEDEKRELTSLAHRSRSAPALARRARIVLACAEGRDNKTVAEGRYDGCPAHHLVPRTITVNQLVRVVVMVF